MSDISSLLTSLVNKQEIIIEDRITLQNIDELLETIDKEIRGFGGSDENEGMKAVDYFPDSFFKNVDIGLDYFEFNPGFEGQPSLIIFTISWENANLTIIPDIFSIQNFSITVEVSGTEFYPELNGVLELEDYQFMANVKLPDLLMEARLSTPPDSQPSPLALLQRFSALPNNDPQTANIPAEAKLSKFNLIANPRARRYFLDFKISNLPLGSHAQVDTEIQLAYTAGTIAASFFVDFEIDFGGGKEISIPILAETDDISLGWQFEGGVATNGITIGDLINHISTKFLDNAPIQTGFADNVVLKYVYLSLNTETQKFVFKTEFAKTDPFPADIKLDFELTKSETGDYTILIAGELSIGADENKRIFDLIYQRQSNSPAGTNAPTTGSLLSHTMMLAQYRKAGGEELTIADFLGGIMTQDEKDAISALSFSVKSALMVFDKEEESPSSSINKYLFSAEIDFGIDLSGLGNLPIIGKQFAGNGALKLAFQPILASKGTGTGINNSDLGIISNLLPPNSISLPEADTGAAQDAPVFQNGFALLTTLSWGNFSKVINLGVAAQDLPEDLPEPAAGEPGATPSGGATAPAPVSEDINKNFGALNISSIQLAYESGSIKIGLDGGLRLGPLEVMVAGLTASYKIDTQEFSASLEGLGVNFSKPPLEISGGFIKMDRGDDPPDYIGEISIQAEAFGIMAIGAFSEVNHQPSMFLYAFLDFPLGGPVFFFVDGLALGFGYNRRLEAPPIDQIYAFPLVADAIGAAPPAAAAPAEGGSDDDSGLSATGAALLRKKLESIGTYIYPQEGQYFLAVGLKFNSFKLLESFALLTIGFGRELEFAIMGITRLGVPVDLEPPVAQIEMAFLAQFKPAEGFLGVQAILTPNSYILSSLCKLEGGFAFFTWFKGEHQGDFVVSIGGYHPNFQPPAHYPRPAAVPRLSFTWALSDRMSIKGQAYFALTPKAMMLGGRLDASFYTNPAKNPANDTTSESQEDKDDDSDFLEAEATFSAGADFIVFWKPFHYEADAFVEIYAKASLNTALGTVSKSLSARADVKLWGPPFAGTAEVKAKVIGIKVKFEVDFGDNANQTPAKITWGKFKTNFLPAHLDTSAVTVGVEKGLVKTAKNDDGQYLVVNPNQLQLNASTIIPITKNNIDGQTAKNIWIAPVVGKRTQTGLGTNQFTEEPALLKSPVILAVEIETEDINGNLKWVDVRPKFTITVLNKKYPKALWIDTVQTNTSPAINGQQMIEAVGGFQLSPKVPPKTSASNTFSVEALQYEIKDIDFEDNVAEFTYTAVEIPSNKKPSFQNLPDATTKRNELLALLNIDSQKEVQLHSKLFDSFTFSPQIFKMG